MGRDEIEGVALMIRVALATAREAGADRLARHLAAALHEAEALMGAPGAAAVGAPAQAGAPIDASWP